MPVWRGNQSTPKLFMDLCLDSRDRPFFGQTPSGSLFFDAFHGEQFSGEPFQLGIDAACIRQPRQKFNGGAAKKPPAVHSEWNDRPVSLGQLKVALKSPAAWTPMSPPRRMLRTSIRSHL
jgi:hypothetical protein